MRSRSDRVSLKRKYKATCEVFLENFVILQKPQRRQHVMSSDHTEVRSWTWTGLHKDTRTRPHAQRKHTLKTHTPTCCVFKVWDGGWRRWSQRECVHQSEERQKNTIYQPQKQQIQDYNQDQDLDQDQDQDLVWAAAASVFWSDRHISEQIQILKV